MSERLSDEELERLEAWARVNSYGGGRQKLSVLALVAEVRRLRAESDALVQAVREQAAHAASQEQVLRSEIHAARSHLEALIAERAVWGVEVDNGPPLDTGRWVRTDGFWKLPSGGDGLVPKLFEPERPDPEFDDPDDPWDRLRVCWRIAGDGYQVVTADDLEAAARIIRANP